MRLLISMSVVLTAVMLAGCASNQPKFAEVSGISNPSADAPSPGADQAAATRTAAVVKPDDALVGRVVSANARGRFAILNFPISRMPAVGETLFIYRDGLKIGQAKISGPQKDDNIVADVINGEARGGDEVRNR